MTDWEFTVRSVLSMLSRRKITGELAEVWLLDLLEQYPQ